MVTVEADSKMRLLIKIETQGHKKGRVCEKHLVEIFYIGAIMLC